MLLSAPEPLRFSEISAAVPQLSDRLLSERIKELERRGVVVRDEVARRRPRAPGTGSPRWAATWSPR